MSTPWGHKITVSIYVAGSLEDAGDVSDQVVGFVNEKDPHGQPYVDVDFVGVKIDTVQDEPKDQGGS